MTVRGVTGRDRRRAAEVLLFVNAPTLSVRFDIFTKDIRFRMVERQIGRGHEE
jgi:hypothetical protein